MNVTSSPTTGRARSARPLAAATSGQQPGFQFFTSDEASEIEAMAAQIIPADGTPGARATSFLAS